MPHDLEQYSQYNNLRNVYQVHFIGILLKLATTYFCPLSPVVFQHLLNRFSVGRHKVSQGLNLG